MPQRNPRPNAQPNLLRTWYGPQRNKWLGPSSVGAVPEWFTGEHHGDYGCGTAGLAADPVTFGRYREADLVHNRWTMLGTLGGLTPELLGKARFPRLGNSGLYLELHKGRVLGGPHMVRGSVCPSGGCPPASRIC